MPNAVTVIHGRIKARSEPSIASAMSGPPGAAGPVTAIAEDEGKGKGKGKGRAKQHEPKREAPPWAGEHNVEGGRFARRVRNH